MKKKHVTIQTKFLGGFVLKNYEATGPKDKKPRYLCSYHPDKNRNTMRRLQQKVVRGYKLVD